MLHWLYPDIFTKKTSELFKASFDLSKGCINTLVLDNLKNLLSVIMLRRMKEDLGIVNNLLPRNEILLFIPLTPIQKAWYTKLLTISDDMISVFHTDETDTKRIETNNGDGCNSLREKRSLNDLGLKTSFIPGKSNGGSANEATAFHSSSRTNTRLLMNLIMQLRKCCIHPYLIPGCKPDPYKKGLDVIQVSGKFIVLKKLLLNIVCERGEKVLIFSGFTTVLDLCEESLSDINRGNRGNRVIKYLRLDGNTCRARRNLHIQLYQNSDFPVMLLTTRAGGLGITLTAANNVIFLDEDWNPQMTLQAEGRAHRIGQTKTVKIYKLCTQGTVEEQMRSRIQKKLYLSTRVTSSVTLDRYGQGSFSPDENYNGKGKKGISDFNQSQLKALVRRGVQVLMHPEINVNELLSWDLATTIKHCQGQAVEYCRNSHDLTEAEEEEWLSKMERIQCAVFEGKRHYRSQQNSDLLNDDLVIEEPRRRKRSTVNEKGVSVSKGDLQGGDENRLIEENRGWSYEHQKV